LLRRLIRLTYRPRYTSVVLLCLSILSRPPAPVLFPYTTLFRSAGAARATRVRLPRADDARPPSATPEAAAEGGRASYARGSRTRERKRTRLNSSHQINQYTVFCMQKKKKNKK